jgi:hypothetical protein
MGESYSPTQARRVLRSMRQNGDQLSDLVQLTCLLAIDRNVTVSIVTARRDALRVSGVRFTADGQLLSRKAAAR